MRFVYPSQSVCSERACAEGAELAVLARSLEFEQPAKQHLMWWIVPDLQVRGAAAACILLVQAALTRC